MSSELGASWVFDRLWGDDLPWWAFLSRLLIKIALAALIAWAIHEWFAHREFDLAPGDIDQINAQTRKALSNAEIDSISVSFSMPPAPQGKGLAYSIDSGRPGADHTLHYFYRLETLGYWPKVTHPTIEDSIDVFLRRIEKEWKGQPGNELRLCAETRKRLDEDVCLKTERARARITGEGEGLSPQILARHLQSIRTGALLLGLVQWITLAVFVFAIIESIGLWLRWIWPKSYLTLDYAKNAETITLLQLEQDVSKTTNNRVRNHFDRYIEKGTVLAKHSSRADVRSALRNFRDHLLEDSSSKRDGLDELGDTILKIAFMGTVYGIGIALYHARDLDAADPLMRLGAKAQMYAGIGMGFGATMLGIGLSILAAKIRRWLAEKWGREIEIGWITSTVFFDSFTGYPIAPTALGAAAGGAVTVGGTKSAPPGAVQKTDVTPIRRPFHPHAMDWLFFCIGAVVLVIAGIWVTVAAVQLFHPWH